MKPSLGSDLKIADILKYYPETKAVFEAHGLAALVGEDGQRLLAPFLTLATALRSRNMDESSFLRLLQEAIDLEETLEAPSLEAYERQGDLTLLALMPCGIKVPFGRAITGFLEKLKEEQNLHITYAVEGNVNQELSYYSYVKTVEKAEELPDIIISADFNSFYGHNFYNKFVADGSLCGYGSPDAGAAFTKAGILDPNNDYSVLGINPLVMVANLDEVGDRPLPTSWQDLLDPMWQSSVTLRGSDQFFCHAVLLPVYQDHGEEGLKKLAGNVLRGLHPAQMVKQIDSGAPGAIYVMPEFFAHRVKKQERIQIIWPEDGALASPVTLQVKSSRIDELKPILDYVSGPQLAEALIGARFPVPHASVQGEVQDKPLRWLGWDFLRQQDLMSVNADIDEVFLPLVKESLKKASGE